MGYLSCGIGMAALHALLRVPILLPVIICGYLVMPIFNGTPSCNNGTVIATDAHQNVCVVPLPGK